MGNQCSWNSWANEKWQPHDITRQPHLRQIMFQYLLWGILRNTTMSCSVCGCPNLFAKWAIHEILALTTCSWHAPWNLWTWSTHKLLEQPDYQPFQNVLDGRLKQLTSQGIGIHQHQAEYTSEEQEAGLWEQVHNEWTNEWLKSSKMK